MFVKKEVPNCTAMNNFKYDAEFYGYKLSELVYAAHKFNCESNNWTFHPLKPGAYGYDSLAVSIAFAISEYEKGNTNLPENIHIGWSKNYVFWRDEKPYEDSILYIRPYVPINDERRNKCAELDFNNLEKDEQIKDYYRLLDSS